MSNISSQLNLRSQSLKNLIPPYQQALINPHASTVEKMLEDHCRQLGIWQPHFAEYNTMTAYLFPTTDAKRLFAIGLYNALLYYIDDSFDRHDKAKAQAGEKLAGVFNYAVDIFLNGEVPKQAHPILQTAYVLHQEFAQLAPDEGWMKRFAKNSIRHLQSSLEAITNTQGKRYASWYEEYVEIRDLDSGMAPTIDLIEFALGQTLPREIYNNGVLKEARLYVTRYCALTNDLFSYDKEVVQHGSRFNAIAMLERDGLYFEQAVERLVLDLNGMVTAFQNLQSKNLAHEAEIYMEGLWQQLIAAYYWQFSTNRYRSESSSFLELRHAVSA